VVNATQEVIFIEEAELFQFTLGNGDIKQNLWKKRSGIQKRTWEEGWKIRSMECGMHERRGQTGSTRLSKRPKADDRPILIFDCGRLQEDHASLIDELNRWDFHDWRLVFRAQRSRREIVCGGKEKSRENRFSHYSLRVQFRSGPWREFLEIGEGNTRTMEFNQDALIHRIRTVAENQKTHPGNSLIGTLPVVLHAGEGALFFHEILGHPLEGDYVASGLSPFTPNDLGRPVFSEPLEIATGDPRDPFFADIGCDDEGQPIASTVLVRDGALQSFVCDRFHQELLGNPQAGHCRVEDFASTPQPRMFGLYLKPGEVGFDDILGETETGVFAREFRDGSLDPFTGRFTFCAQETYRIEKGRIDRPLGVMQFSGELREVLGEIGRIGNDFRYDKGISFCQKNGQVLPVRVGQPTVKINRLHCAQEPHD